MLVHKFKLLVAGGLMLAAVAGGLAAAAVRPDDPKLKAAPPVVVKTVPEAGADGVDPALTELKVTFSKPMTDKTWSWSTAPEEFGALPEIVGDPAVAFDDKLKTCTLKVKLAPDTTYAVWVNSDRFRNFKDADGTPAVPYLLTFRTKGK